MSISKETKTTTKRTMKAPKTPKTKVNKEVATQFESNSIDELQEQVTKTKSVKEEPKETIKQGTLNIQEQEQESDFDELSEIENIELTSDTKENESQDQEQKQENELEEMEMENTKQIGDVTTILDKQDFTKLSLEEQKDLMNHYVNVDKFTNEQLKIHMQLSTSQFYRLLEKLGLHKRGQQSFRRVTPPKAPTKTPTKAKREIGVEFINGGVILEGDLDLEELLTRVEGFLNFGGGNEGDYEFRFELIRK